MIKFAINCRRCLSELPQGMSPAEFARQQLVITEDNELAAWCNRHDELIGVLTVGQRISEQLLSMGCEGLPKERTARN